MCIEDIRLGRQLAAMPKTVALNAATPTPLCGGDEKRTRLIVAGGAAGNIFIGPPGVVPTTTVGIPLVAGYPIHVFKVEEWGKIVTGSWSAIAAAGTPVVVVTECSLEKD